MSEFFYYMFQPYWKYADFSGRARRKEFWAFMLFNVVATIVFIVLDVLLAIYYPMGSVFSVIFYFVSIVPFYAVLFRRAHDVDISGWVISSPYIMMVLIPFIILFGEIFLIYALVIGIIGFVCFSALYLYVSFFKGNDGINKYGDDPLSEKMVKRSITFSGREVKRFFHYMFLPLRKCITFSGRGRRLEFWAFTLFVIVVLALLYILDSYLNLLHYYEIDRDIVQTNAETGAVTTTEFNADVAIGIFSGIGFLVFLVPYFSLLVRRMHDIKMSAWFIFVYIVGLVFLLSISVIEYNIGLSDSALLILSSFSFMTITIVLFLNAYISLRLGDVGANRYGVDPLTEKVA